MLKVKSALPVKATQNSMIISEGRPFVTRGDMKHALHPDQDDGTPLKAMLQSTDKHTIYIINK